MQKYLIYFLFFGLSTLSFSYADEGEDPFLSEIQLPSESEPSVNVAGCVNAITGGYFNVETDLLTNTIEPISIVKFYDSQSKIENYLGFGFGTQFPLYASDRLEGKLHSYLHVSEKEGSLLSFRGPSENGGKSYKANSKMLEKGFTNAGSEIGGRTNLVNRRIRRNSEAKEWVVKLENGGKRIYGNCCKPNTQVGKKLCMKSKINLLKKEIKPNGNVLTFEYGFDDTFPYLTNVKTYNRTETKVLSNVSVKKVDSSIIYSSECGQNVTYVKELFKGHDKIRNSLNFVSSNQNSQTSYSYKKTERDRPLLENVYKPRGYQQTMEYDSKKRVKKLHHTSGINDALVLTHCFEYDDRSTEVIDGLGKKTIYLYDKNKRINEIQYWSEDTIIRTDKFNWHEEKDGWLASKSINDAKGEIYSKAYEYDKYGNVLKEHIKGKITGLSACDTLTIAHEYSEDGFHLPIKTIYPEGLVVNSSYLAGTNLKIKETNFYNNKIQERHFWKYDDNGQVSEYSEDDGSGEDETDYTDAKYRLVKVIRSVQDASSAAFGKPEVEENYYVRIHERDQILLNKTVYSYDGRGNKVKVSTLDSMGHICAEESKVYDLNNRIIQETDAFGSVTLYSYDVSNNRIKEEFLASGKVIHYEYNSTNKLIRKETIFSSEDHRVETYTYNILGELVSDTDELNRKTEYVYDRLGHIIERSFEIFSSQNSVVTVSTKNSYNAIGQIVSETNERGAITHYTRNIFGKPLRIDYADGSFETRTYSIQGRLLQVTSSDGTIIVYENDAKGRVVSKHTKESNGNVLESQASFYKGLKLISKVGPISINYQYDEAGRLIGTQELGVKTVFNLDDFGRIKSSVEDDRLIFYEYDALGQVISKSKESTDGKIFSLEKYEYDFAGNLIRRSAEVCEGEFTTSTKLYNNDNSLKEAQDELGHVTSFSYERNRLNPLGQKLLETTEIDALNRVLKTYYDARQCVVKEEIIKDNQLLFSKEVFYDENNLPVKEVMHVLHDQESKDYTLQKKYDLMGRLIELNEADQKVTVYEYDTLGRMTKKTLPDQTILYMLYDGLGRCVKKYSSDKSVDYDYKYDLNSNLIEVNDRVSSKTFQRVYDTNNRILKEQFLEDLYLSYTYDRHGRVTQIILPDQSGVNYIYDAYHLKAVQRLSSEGEIRYEIFCNGYDKKGRLLETTSSASSTKYSYDQIGHLLSISSDKFEGVYDQYDALGNLQRSKEVIGKDETNKSFEYDGLLQLVKEEGTVKNSFAYNSLGSCVSFNEHPQEFNSLNQLLQNENTSFEYDANGRLIAESNPKVKYTYDSLGRLKNYLQNDSETTLNYDGANRCIQIINDQSDKSLLYFGDKEIASIENGKLKEFRLVHPAPHSEQVFALEIENTPYFVQQDQRGNIVLLQNEKGYLVDKYAYSSFKEETATSKNLSPWRYSNRRQIGSLSLYTNRLYHPNQRRWLTPDPLDFVDGYNMYRFVRNNPYSYSDPDGCEPISISFTVLVLSLETFGTIAASYPAIPALIAASVAYCGVKTFDHYAGTNTFRYATNKITSGCNVVAESWNCSLTRYVHSSLSQYIKLPHPSIMNQEVTVQPESAPNTEAESTVKPVKEITFPENPEEISDEYFRDEKGNIYLEDNLRIRPEVHEFDEGDKFNPRHHEQHYHVESRLKGKGSWGSKKVKIYKPEGYFDGMGTGFLKGETFKW